MQFESYIHMLCVTSAPGTSCSGPSLPADVITGSAARLGSENDVLKYRPHF